MYICTYACILSDVTDKVSPSSRTDNHTGRQTNSTSSTFTMTVSNQDTHARSNVQQLAQHFNIALSYGHRSSDVMHTMLV